MTVVRRMSREARHYHEESSVAAPYYQCVSASEVAETTKDLAQLLHSVSVSALQRKPRP